MLKKEFTEEELAEQIALENLAEKNCLVRVVAGSHAYGTNNENSDWDERAIFADEAHRIILPFDKIEQVEFRHDDVVSFELSKYMPLLLSQNPNVIELLWTDEKDVLYKSDMGQLLIDNRKEFLSKKVKDSYVGYAMSQLKRIKGHNKWINNPQPEREPEQGDYTSVVWNYTSNKDFNRKVPTIGYVAVSIGNHSYSLWEAIKLGLPADSTWIDKRGNPKFYPTNEFTNLNADNLPPALIAKINFEVFEYEHNNWKMFWKWKNNRNEKRSELEEKYGYDVKHAMHLIRLLKSGIDILTYGVVPVKRDDAAYLLDIRNGVYTYEEIVTESTKLSQKVEEISLKTSLKEEPNRELAKEIMTEIYTNTWGLKPERKSKFNI